MNTSDYQYIKFEQNGPVAYITFNRPNVLNSLNNQLIEESLNAFNRLDQSTRVLVLRGEGNEAFAAGADLKEMQNRTWLSEMDYGPRRELARKLETSSFPTVAAVKGWTLGGGFELALSCQFRFANEDAIMGLPEVSLGIIPGNGGTQRLTRLIGKTRAIQAILLNEKINANEAEKLGIVNEVFSNEQFDEELNKVVLKLSKLAPIATRAALDCIEEGAEMSLNQALKKEHQWFMTCLTSKDKDEGVNAFLEKRPAQFKGV